MLQSEANRETCSHWMSVHILSVSNKGRLVVDSLRNMKLREEEYLMRKIILLIYWRGWTATLAGSNEADKLELSRAWKPLDR